MTSDPSCTAVEAVQRGRMIVNARTGQYGLGSGDYSPPPYPPGANGDVPWTPSPDPKFPGPASDCAGFAICFAWKIHRHRLGFNHGWWATIEDDVNNNSAMEDGWHKHELFDTLGSSVVPQSGDLIVYPTIYLHSAAGELLRFIGHVGLVEEVPHDYKAGEGWHRLTILQCHGPDGYKPGAVRTDGSVWDVHDSKWPKPEHRTVIVRPKERK